MISINALYRRCTRYERAPRWQSDAGTTCCAQSRPGSHVQSAKHSVYRTGSTAGKLTVQALEHATPQGGTQKGLKGPGRAETIHLGELPSHKKMQSQRLSACAEGRKRTRDFTEMGCQVGVTCMTRSPTRRTLPAEVPPTHSSGLLWAGGLSHSCNRVLKRDTPNGPRRMGAITCAMTRLSFTAMC